MDAAAIVFAIALIIMILFHPGTQMFIKHLKSKSKARKGVQETRKCYHTPDDCLNCVASIDCPIKNENVVHVIKHNDNYTD